MRTYSQTKEDLFVANLFGSYKGTLLDIGANDGITLSNSRLLIENNWNAYLLEPGKVFERLKEVYTHYFKEQVHLYNFGIGICTPGGVKLPFFESGAHVPGGKDTGLVSSISREETERWRSAGVEFERSEIQIFNFKDFWDLAGNPQFDFISIDAEGMDWEILNQIDLNVVGCKVLCIEWNGDRELGKKITDYCKGFKLVERNNENLIFSKL